MINIFRALFGSFLFLFIVMLMYEIGIEKFSPLMLLVFPHVLSIFIAGVFYWFCCIRPEDKEDNVFKIKVLLTHFILIFTLYFIWYVTFPREEFTDNFLTGSNIDNVVKLLTIFILAPISEEIIYRGIIFDNLIRIKSNNRLILITSAFVSSFIFVLYHTQYEHISTIILLFLVALVLCSARYLSKTLWIPIVIHSFASLCAISL